MKMLKMIVGSVVLGVVMGCVSGGGAEGTQRPTKAALYVGKGALARTTWHWLQIVTLADGMETILVDGEQIRKGALDGVDVLIVPGGSSHAMSASLGADGRKAIVDFVRQGGGYIGACAGAYLVSETSESHPNMLNLMPYTSRDGHGRADLRILFNENAKKYGLKARSCQVTYGEGPVFEPGEPVADTDFEVLATYDSNIASWTDQPQPKMSGHAAIVAGRCGKGKIFAVAVHPEVNVARHDILRAGFRFVTGRSVDWKIPQRRRGDLCVGVDMTKGFDTVASAEAMRGLIRGAVPGVDLLPLTHRELSDGSRRHLDVVIPATEAGCRSVASLVKEPAKVLPPYPDKKPRVRVAAFADEGGVNRPVTERLALSPEFDVDIVTGADIQANKIKDYDMLLLPGGWAPTQYKVIGTNGCENIKRYVREGGSVYAICAGAFLISQTVDVHAPRGDMIPWSDLGDYHFRGGGPIAVRITEEGAKNLGVPVQTRDIIYWGGPVFEPGKTPVPDCDIRSWGDYFGHNFNTCSSKDLPPMGGHAAFLGGTYGKGKVFVSAPHPEKDEQTFDIVDGAVRYLTGVKPQGVNRNRSRGALSVALPLYRNTAFTRMVIDSLLRDRSLDLRIGWTSTELKHLDVVVVAPPSADSLTNELKEFAENGGTVIALADTPKRQAAVKGKDWVKVVTDVSEVPAVLKGL